MKKDKQKTEVIFRKFPEGDVIAIFPFEKFDLNGNYTSYMHIGQHGGCSLDLAKDLIKPSKEECQDLIEELGSIGYNLDILNEYEHKDASYEKV